MEDRLKTKIVNIIKQAKEPLETKEILNTAKGTRIMVLMRLHELRGEGLVKGKHIGSGKGTWIWWNK